LPYAM